MNATYRNILNYLYHLKEKIELKQLHEQFEEKDRGVIQKHITYMIRFNLVSTPDNYIELNGDMKNICSILLQDIPDKEKAFNVCIQHIKEESSVNTEWAYSVVFGENKAQPHHIHKKLSAKLIESNEYAREKTGDTFEIFKNPDYQLRTSTLSTNRATKRALLLTITIGAISTAATVKSCQISNQQHNESIEVKSRDSLIKQLNNKISQKDSNLNSLFGERDSLLKEIDALKKSH
jgi:hypothetical protein